MPQLLVHMSGHVWTGSEYVPMTVCVPLYPAFNLLLVVTFGHGRRRVLVDPIRQLVLERLFLVFLASLGLLLASFVLVIPMPVVVHRTVLVGLVLIELREKLLCQVSGRRVRHNVPFCLLVQVVGMMVMWNVLQVDPFVIEDGGEAIEEHLQDTVVPFVHRQFAVDNFLLVCPITTSDAAMVVKEGFSLLMHLICVEEKVI